MTLYMLFAGLGILICAGVALAGTTIANFSEGHIAFGLQFAYLASLSVFFAAGILFYPSRFLRERSSSVDCSSHFPWKARFVILALLFLSGGGGAILIAATRGPGDALGCAGQCRAVSEAIVGHASSNSGTDLKLQWSVANRRHWLRECDCFRSAAVPIAIDRIRRVSVQRSMVSSAARSRTRRAESRSSTNRTCAKPF
jgi:hypothetical protein